jgi:hypothetical protein
MSQIDSSTPGLPSCRWYDGSFHLSLSIEWLLQIFDSAAKQAFWIKMKGFGDFEPLNENWMSQNPEKAPTSTKMRPAVWHLGTCKKRGQV